MVPMSPENFVVLPEKKIAPSSHLTPHVTTHGGPKQEVSAEFMPHEEKIPYTRYGDQIFVQGYVHGSSIKFELDGRQHNSVFGKNHVRQLGLKVPSGPPTKTCDGVSADPVPAWEMEVPIALGAFRVIQQIDVIEKLHAPILGQTFLTKMPHLIDHYSMNYITFTHSAKPAPKIVRNDRRPTVDVPFKVRGGRIVEALVNGKTVEMNSKLNLRRASSQDLISRHIICDPQKKRRSTKSDCVGFRSCTTRFLAFKLDRFQCRTSL